MQHVSIHILGLVHAVYLLVEVNKFWQGQMKHLLEVAFTVLDLETRWQITKGSKYLVFHSQLLDHFKYTIQILLVHIMLLLLMAWIYSE